MFIKDNEKGREGNTEKYDENNNLIYFKDSGSYESWAEYDKNNKKIHCKNNSGYECW